jgi:outer membrane lipoprotein SlyB
MKKIAVLVVAASLSLAPLSAANAKGCLKGAAVGAVAGHFVHRHTVLGAVAGCVIGHHMAVKKEQQEKTQHQQQQSQHPAPQGH